MSVRSSLTEKVRVKHYRRQVSKQVSKEARNNTSTQELWLTGIMLRCQEYFDWQECGFEIVVFSALDILECWNFENLEWLSAEMSCKSWQKYRNSWPSAACEERFFWPVMHEREITVLLLGALASIGKVSCKGPCGSKRYWKVNNLEKPGEGGKSLAMGKTRFQKIASHRNDGKTSFAHKAF